MMTGALVERRSPEGRVTHESMCWVGAAQERSWWLFEQDELEWICDQELAAACGRPKPPRRVIRLDRSQRRGTGHEV